MPPGGKPQKLTRFRVQNIKPSLQQTSTAAEVSQQQEPERQVQETHLLKLDNIDMIVTDLEHCEALQAALTHLCKYLSFQLVNLLPGQLPKVWRVLCAQVEVADLPLKQVVSVTCFWNFYFK